MSESAGADYADVRVCDTTYETLKTRNLEIVALHSGDSTGAGLRILKDGGWGFASTQDFSELGLDSLVRRSLDNAIASSSTRRKKITLVEEPTYKDKWCSPFLVDPFAVDIDCKAGVLFEASTIMMRTIGIGLTRGFLSFTKELRVFANSQGSEIEQTFVRSACGIEAIARNDFDQQSRSYPCLSGQMENAGWELVSRWDLVGNAERIASEAVQLLSADSCPQITADGILGSCQMAVQIHETCGHPCELDRALGHEINFAGTSFLSAEHINQLQYGTEIVNLVADACSHGALGGFKYDDEGVAAQQVYLVRNGIFSNFLSSRDITVDAERNRSGGMCRAESWNFQPMIRMTNISLLPGSGSLEQLISNTEYAILMETNKSWSIDDRRKNFQFSTEIAWEIKNGKRHRLLKNASYGGESLEFWNSCDAICGPEEFVEWGLWLCGKGQPNQPMLTGHGSAPARFKNLQIGIARS